MASEDADHLERKLAQYREKGVSKVKLGLTDMDGVLRGKYVGWDKFSSLLSKQGGFCDVVLGWDVQDRLYDKSRYTGWHTGYPDTGYRLLPETERWLADEACPFFIADFVNPDGSAHPLCPRTRLNAVLAQLADAGFCVRSGFEYEFFVFDETAHSVRDKGYRDLRLLTPGNFGYSVLRTTVQADRFTGLMDYVRALDCDLEGLHCETGPGVWEGALQSTIGIDAADRAALFKTFTKAYFQRQGLIATFMAKWSMKYPGQSGHYHFSLSDDAGVNRFFDAGQNHGMAALQRHAVAGLCKYLPQFIALVAPTINSYTRLVKGAWAPTAATWGIENRTVAVRVIPGNESGQRIECRVGGADGNPYLVAAAVLAAALAGIREKLEPDRPVAGNAYDVEDDLPESRQFPSNLGDAADRLERSTQARDSLGDEFVDHFVMTRRWEVAEYEKNLNSWQLERYFEII